MSWFMSACASATSCVASLCASATSARVSAGSSALLQAPSDAAKAPAYLALPNVACVGGSWMLPADALAARDWTRIGDLAREAAALKR